MARLSQKDELLGMLLAPCPDFPTPSLLDSLEQSDPPVLLEQGLVTCSMHPLRALDPVSPYLAMILLSGGRQAVQTRGFDVEGISCVSCPQQLTFWCLQVSSD